MEKNDADLCRNTMCLVDDIKFSISWQLDTTSCEQKKGNLTKLKFSPENYSRITIVQEYDPKERLEELEINIDVVTISSVDAVNMCTLQ